MREHLRRETEALIAAKYTRQNGEPWAEIPMAKAMGISQSQLNAIRHGKNAGSNALIALSRETGKSINALLGPTAPTVSDARSEAVAAKATELFEKLRDFGFAGKHLAIPRLVRELSEALGIPALVLPAHAAPVLATSPEEPSEQRRAVDEPDGKAGYQSDVREMARRSPLGKKKKTKTADAVGEADDAKKRVG